MTLNRCVKACQMHQHVQTFTEQRLLSSSCSSPRNISITPSGWVEQQENSKKKLIFKSKGGYISLNQNRSTLKVCVENGPGLPDPWPLVYIQWLSDISQKTRQISEDVNVCLLNPKSNSAKLRKRCAVFCKHFCKVKTFFIFICRLGDPLKGEGS